MDDYKALCARIADLQKAKTPLVVAIDGPCGGGKTTLAFKLHKAFPDSVIVHADDFFLRPHQRTEERLKKPGGNMDRERLQEEVLQKVPLVEPFTYSSYDCQQDVTVPVRYEPRSLVIVEGSYSHHPDLKPSYDLLVFVDVDDDTQLDRLKMRVPAKLLPNFINQWIPLEHMYFDAFHIKENSDFVLNM